MLLLHTQTIPQTQPSVSILYKYANRIYALRSFQNPQTLLYRGLLELALQSILCAGGLIPFGNAHKFNA